MNNPAVRYGLIAGFIGILFNLILYLISPDSMGGVWGLIIYIVVIACMVLAAKEEKKLETEHYGFKKALKPAFLTSVIALALLTLFSYLLFNVIDPDYAVTAKEKSIEKTIEWMEGMGAPENVIEERVREMEDQDFYGLSSMLMYFAISCIIGFIVALIIAAVVKEKKPQITA